MGWVGRLCNGEAYPLISTFHPATPSLHPGRVQPIVSVQAKNKDLWPRARNLQLKVYPQVQHHQHPWPRIQLIVPGADSSLKFVFPGHILLAQSFSTVSLCYVMP
jgi:hypothetical protein